MQDTLTSTSATPAVVCFPFAGGRVGGSHISALKLIGALDRDRYRPLVVVHALDGPVARLLTAHGVVVEQGPVRAAAPAGSWRGLARSLAQAGPLADFLRRRGVLIVHTNDGPSHAAWALPTRLAAARLVWHHRAGPDARGLRLVAPWVADRVIAVSSFAAPRPGLFSAARKCSVVPSPFDSERPELDRVACRAAACAELGVDPSTYLLGFFGTLVHRKRPLAFVEAIAALAREAPGLPVLGLVFGNARAKLDETAAQRARELGIEHAIRFMGFRYPPEPWLAACDVLLVPAVGEPFGRTLIEAMLLGTPVVATASGGNPEAIEDGRTGFLVPPDAPEALARVARPLLERPALRATIARAAREDAQRRFGVDRHAQAVMAVYDHLMNDHRPA